MINHWQKLLAAGFLLFLGLWIAGFIRSFTLTTTELQAPPVLIVSSKEDFRSNSNRQAHNLVQIGLMLTPLPKVLDQEDVNKIKVFEKTGRIASGTTAFADEEERIRKALAAHKADIVSEKAAGIAPQRSLSLEIGVHPDRFDGLLHDLNQVGQIQSINVQQQDRTGEFRKLHAQRQSLKKYQGDIQKLRGASSKSLEDGLRLEQKNHEIEKEIQSLDVQLGDFLDKEPIYNLFVTLQEYQPGSWQDRSHTIPWRVGTAFVWALSWWFVTVFCCGLLVATYVSIQTLRSIRSSVVTTAPGAPG